MTNPKDPLEEVLELEALYWQKVAERATAQANNRLPKKDKKDEQP